jgi:proteasome lid subunit RPN8/RPN11
VRASERAILSPSALEVIARQCREMPGQEICGLLVGRFENGEVRVTKAIPTRNSSTDARRGDWFEIDPLEYVRITDSLEGSGEEVVGCHHSHPQGNPYPSSADVERALRGVPFVYMIERTLEDGEIDAWGLFDLRDGEKIPIETEVREP